MIPRLLNTVRRFLCRLGGHAPAHGYTDRHGTDWQCDRCGHTWYEERT